MILWLGFFVVKWPVPDLVKYVIIALPSFVITMLTYEYAVRRVSVLRILFGMKPLRRPRSSDVRVPVTQPAG